MQTLRKSTYYLLTPTREANLSRLREALRLRRRGPHMMSVVSDLPILRCVPVSPLKSLWRFHLILFSERRPAVCPIETPAPPGRSTHVSDILLGTPQSCIMTHMIQRDTYAAHLQATGRSNLCGTQVYASCLNSASHPIPPFFYWLTAQRPRDKGGCGCCLLDGRYLRFYGHATAGLNQRPACGVFCKNR